MDKSITIVIFVIFFLSIAGFSDGQKKKQDASGLSERFQQIMDMSSKRTVIRLSGNRYRELVRTSPRNYSVVVMFTALSPKRQCVICKHALDEYTIVANSFRYQQMHTNQLFFALVDFDEAQDVFQQLKLNTAPVIMHFPAKGKPKRTDTMDIQRVGFAAEAVARWVGEQTEIHIRVLRPPNYSATIALIALFAVIGGLLYLRRNNLEFLYNKSMWGVMSLFFVFTMTSGQMWNHIRGPPFVHRTPAGNIAYVHGSSQGQFVLETYIVMGISAVTVVGMILMTEAASGKGDIRKRRIMSIVGLGLMAFFFSLILSVFRSKAGGYPYSFLLK
uniref:EOG090X09EZ n=1 Tax=Moina brachiata TaxID=675436 RepID=A0A4Y7NJR2_9CRUS|nr:EOG090X09EZ [Moina brachiata]SVE93123.1 EOG090X09EZ [Moina brachiata]